MVTFFDDVRMLFRDFDIWGAFWMNIKLTFSAGVLSFILGLILVIMRVSPVSSLRRAAAIYVMTVRNIPLTLVILACSLGLWGQLGIKLAPKGPDFLATNSFRLAVLGLSVYTACFVCESLRSGINTVAPGQIEAARSIGLGFSGVMRFVVLPQAIRGSITPLGNTLVALAKNTTVAQAAGVVQAASFMIMAIEQHGSIITTIFAVVAAGWVIIVLPIGLLTTALSRRFGVAR